MTYNRILILSSTLNTLDPSSRSLPNAACLRPIDVRSSGSKTSQDPTNSSISTFTPNRPRRKRASREADFAFGAIKTRIFELRDVGNGIQVAVGPRSQADDRADIGDEAVLAGTIMLSDRPGIGPRPEEQLEKPAVEQVQEAGECVIAHHQPAQALVRRGQRQRALRAEQAEKLDDDLQSALSLRNCGKIGCRKFEIGILTEIDILLAAGGAVTDPRAVGICPLELPQHVIEIEPPGFSLHLVEQFHSELRVPIRGGHRMISPRSVVEMTVWVKWLNPE